jgi:hypothetical protein
MFASKRNYNHSPSLWFFFVTTTEHGAYFRHNRNVRRLVLGMMRRRKTLFDLSMRGLLRFLDARRFPASLKVIEDSRQNKLSPNLARDTT